MPSLFSLLHPGFDEVSLLRGELDTAVRCICQIALELEAASSPVSLSDIYTAIDSEFKNLKAAEAKLKQKVAETVSKVDSSALTAEEMKALGLT
jgi:hypothetical protein